MAYEVDFIGVGEKSKKDADAICLRWLDSCGRYKIAVYDTGFQAHGEKMVEHLNRYYFDDQYNRKQRDEKIIDYVIISHSDQDHVSGTEEIFKNFLVKRLYMNRPWLYVDELYSKIDDKRITKASLRRRLRENFSYIAEVETLATYYGVPINEVFNSALIEDKFLILSPSKDFYIDLLVESNKTPLEESSNDTVMGRVIVSGLLGKILSQLKNLVESWFDEKLREDVSTSAENETSVVLLGIDEECFLLTGDSGIRGLRKSIDYANSLGVSLKDNVKFYQVPHHGGRHNVSPSILNDLIGTIVAENTEGDKVAFVSVAKDSDHPLQMVVNAFVRRGVKIYKTNGDTIHHCSENMPDREGWEYLEKLKFSKQVEEWDD